MHKPSRALVLVRKFAVTLESVRSSPDTLQAVNAFKDPSEVVQEALVALRKADTERCAGFAPCSTCS